jgi:enoyl-CoA hydratase/carnithine racemase
MTAELKSTTEGSTMVLTLSNPSQRNALDPAIYAAGIEALNGAESSAEVRSVVIAGEGAWFCTGESLQWLRENRRQPASVQVENVEGLHNWIDSIRTFPKPVIAAVEGAATGAGFSLALACDLVVAARDAVFAASHGDMALSPNGGLSWHLAQSLPRQLATEWLMGGERIAATRLHALGLVNELADNGQALSAALQLSERLGAKAPNALASVKDLLAEARGATLSTHLAQERDHFVRNLNHANAGTGIAAFLAGETPRYE